MEKEAIMATLENYASAYCYKDIDALMKVFVDSDDISLIGTGADELCGGRDAVMKVFLRNFEEATAEQFEWHWSHITVSADCAVVVHVQCCCSWSCLVQQQKSLSLT